MYHRVTIDDVFVSEDETRIRKSRFRIQRAVVARHVERSPVTVCVRKWRADKDKSGNFYTIVIKGPLSWSDRRDASLFPRRRRAEELVEPRKGDIDPGNFAELRLEIRNQVVADTGASKKQAFNAVDRAIRRILNSNSDSKQLKATTTYGLKRQCPIVFMNIAVTTQTSVPVHHDAAPPSCAPDPQ